MKGNLIKEQDVLNILHQIISEETAKVKREDFNRVQFKLEELQNSVNESIKDLRRLQDSIPTPLKTTTTGRINTISSHLSDTNKLINQLKDRVKQYKRTHYSQQVENKKKS